MTNKDKTVRVYTTGCVCGKGERERKRKRCGCVHGVCSVYVLYLGCVYCE